MKKLLGIVVLGLLWCNAGISAENKFSIKDLNIDLPSEYKLQKIGSNIGDYGVSSPYINIFYAQAKDGKLFGLLEIFHIDTSYDWIGKVFTDELGVALFKKDSDFGCGESSSKQYSQVIREGRMMHCVSVKILNKEEIHSPNSFGFIGSKVNIPGRKDIVKKFIDKNNLEVPDQMVRSEHFLFTGKQFIWVFFTDLTSDNLTSEQVNHNIANAIDMHKGFENDLKFKPKIKIDFSEYKIAEIKIPKKVVKKERKDEEFKSTKPIIGSVLDLNIRSSDEYKLKKVGNFGGNLWSRNNYKNVFYTQVNKEDKIIGLVETFYLTHGGGSWWLDPVRELLFDYDPNSGCNRSSTKRYFQGLNKGAKGIHCVSVKVLNEEGAISSSPNFTHIERAQLPRKSIIKKIIKKNNIKVPDQMLRSEHFFYNKKSIYMGFFH